MTIVYVDTEHDRVIEHPELGASHQARVESARTRLTTIGGLPCEVRHYTKISPRDIEHAAPTALVIGGSMTDWSAYDMADLAGLFATIRAAPLPILGICAGHQLIGHAHGADGGPLGPLDAGETDPDPEFGPGQRKERGFLDVDLDSRCPLFQGLPPKTTFFQLHYWQLKEAPSGFAIRARSSWTAVQAIERLDRPVFGVQFHPERYDAVHPHGEIVLRNFLALAQNIARE
jgi:GMP synthase-like glutamine amidotransferase